MEIDNELILFLQGNHDEIKKRWFEAVEEELMFFESEEIRIVFQEDAELFFLLFISFLKKKSFNLGQEPNMIGREIGNLTKSFIFYKNLLQELVWEEYSFVKKAYLMDRRIEDICQEGLECILNYYKEEAGSSDSDTSLDFIATLNYELRTILTAVLGYSDLMRNEALGTLQEDYKYIASNVKMRCYEMFMLIEDLAALVKLRNQSLEIKKQKVNLSEIVKDVYLTLSSIALENNIELISAVRENFPLFWADESSLKHIITNLVSNGIKFNKPSGYVKIEAEESPEFIEIKVSDSGKGIKKEDQTLIFEKFKQLEDSYHKKVAGAGLGLAIAQELAKLHQGEIKVESSSGNGSTFTVSILRE